MKEFQQKAAGKLSTVTIKLLAIWDKIRRCDMATMTLFALFTPLLVVN